MNGSICELGVAARVVQKGAILLVQEARGRYQNMWGLPKGRVDQGEQPESAVIRELQEESGAIGTILGLAAVRSTMYKDTPALFLCFDVHVDSHGSSLSNGEIKEMGWFKLEELKNLEWVSETMHNLAIDALSGSRMSIHSSVPLSKNDGEYFVYSVNKHSESIA